VRQQGQHRRTGAASGSYNPRLQARRKVRRGSHAANPTGYCALELGNVLGGAVTVPRRTCRRTAETAEVQRRSNQAADCRAVAAQFQLEGWDDQKYVDVVDPFADAMRARHSPELRASTGGLARREVREEMEELTTGWSAGTTFETPRETCHVVTGLFVQPSRR
jgi:hypothetical protein